MQYDFEFQIEPRDVFRYFMNMWNRRSFLSYALRGIAVCSLIWMAVESLANAHYWTVALLLFIIPTIAVPGLHGACTLSCIVAIWKPHIRVSFNEDGVTHTGGKYSQLIPWSSFAIAGSVTESTDIFDFKCARADIQIPVRVFSSPEIRRDFKAYLREHLPDCCRLDLASGAE